MRIAFYGLMAASAVLATACSPAVGSPDWCKQFQANNENKNPMDVLSNLTPEEQKGIEQCMMNAFSGALGQ